MMVFMFGLHEYLSLCLLKVLFNGWFLGKQLSTMDKNLFPSLVFKFEFHRGLYHIFLF